MTRFTERVERDLGQIADRATPSSTAWGAIQQRIDEQDINELTLEVIMLSPERNESPTTSHRWMRVAAAAAALVLVGGLIFATTRADEDPVPADQPELTVPAAPSTSLPAVPSSALTQSAALETVEAYYAAVEAGDAEAITATFTENPTLGEGLVDLVELIRGLAWDVGQGTILVDRSCTVDNAESTRVVVACEYGMHQYLQRVVNAPATPKTEVFVVTPDGIEDFADTYGAPLFPANDAFNSWMVANHPEDATAADCCGGDGSVGEARAAGELRQQYADLWAVHLEETGCTYTEIGC
jgi:hypothetical protein